MKSSIRRSIAPRERGGLKYTGLSINSHYSCSCHRNRHCCLTMVEFLRGTAVEPVVSGLILAASSYKYPTGRNLDKVIRIKMLGRQPRPHEHNYRIV